MLSLTDNPCSMRLLLGKLAPEIAIERRPGLSPTPSIRNLGQSLLVLFRLRLKAQYGSFASIKAAAPAMTAVTNQW